MTSVNQAYGIYQSLNMFRKCELMTIWWIVLLAFLTPCDQAFNPPFLGGKIIELAKFCFKNKRFEPSLLFFSKQVIVSHCV